jgi:hypothetical protein
MKHHNLLPFHFCFPQRCRAYQQILATLICRPRTGSRTSLLVPVLTEVTQGQSTYYFHRFHLECSKYQGRSLQEERVCMKGTACGPCFTRSYYWYYTRDVLTTNTANQIWKEQSMTRTHFHMRSLDLSILNASIWSTYRIKVYSHGEMRNKNPLSGSQVVYILWGPLMQHLIKIRQRPEICARWSDRRGFPYVFSSFTAYKKCPDSLNSWTRCIKGIGPSAPWPLRKQTKRRSTSVSAEK